MPRATKSPPVAVGQRHDGEVPALQRADKRQLNLIDDNSLRIESQDIPANAVIRRQWIRKAVVARRHYFIDDNLIPRSKLSRNGRLSHLRRIDQHDARPYRYQRDIHVVITKVHGMYDDRLMNQAL